MEETTHSIPAWPYLVSGGATMLAAIVALFGDRLRSLMFKPKLAICLLNEEGELVDQTVTSQSANALAPPTQFKHGVRWWHLKIENIALGRWPTAQDVRIYLVRLEEERQGRFVVLWAEKVPLSLRHEHQFSPRRTAGPAIESDFFAVTDGQLSNGHPQLCFQVPVAPNNSVVIFHGPVTLRATVLADSIEVESKPASFIIRWDGKWISGAEEMKKHLQISTEPKAA